MLNQHHFLVLLQAENPHQLPSKKDALWKGVISQPKGVKTQPKGVFSSGVILRVFKTISFRQPASQMGVQLFGCWLLEYYVSLFFFNGNLQHISIHRARIAAGQRGSKKTSPIKWNAFFFERPFFLAVQEAPFFLLPVDLGMQNAKTLRFSFQEIPWKYELLTPAEDRFPVQSPDQCWIQFWCKTMQDPHLHNLLLPVGIVVLGGRSAKAQALCPFQIYPPKTKNKTRRRPGF